MNINQTPSSSTPPEQSGRDDSTDPVWSVERIRGLGATTDLRTAGRIFGLSANTSYELARRHRFPVPVFRAGRQYRVPVEAILALLHGHPTPPAPASD